jgi:RNA 2',3'-cyclic 3'-phosphodiesterase
MTSPPDTPGPATARLFVALWPTAAVRRSLLGQQRAWQWPRGAALVKPERLHVTLHFLGEVPAARIVPLTQALAVPTERFSLSLASPELWPHGIAVLRPHQTPDALLRLHARLRDALQAFGWPTEARAFRPHVTFARRAAGAVPPPDVAPSIWRVSGHVLVHSMPGPAGGYRVIAHYR